MMTQTKIQTQVRSINRLLDLADTQSTNAIRTYVRACEELVAGYASGRIEDYMAQIVKASQAMGRPRSRHTFFNMWTVGLGLKKKRVPRKDLLACSSRREILRIVPAAKPRRVPHDCVWTSVRVSTTVHRQLLKLARQADTTINDVIVGLLGPAVKKAA
jgi:hypothetical protein